MPATELSYTIQKRRQKLYIKVYAVLCLIIIASVGFYSYQKWLNYNFVKQVVANNKQFISEIRGKVAEGKSLYESNKEGYDDLNKEIEEKLALIFPSTDDYTSLTRQFDTYEQDLSKINNPFEVSSINYQPSSQTPLYSILPLKMDIRSSSENFTKFLQLIENSGALDNQDRLMDISSIRLNFETGEEEQEETINFSVQINAYFQK